MKLQLTTITRIMIYLATLALLAVCTILLPELAREEAAGKPNPPSAYPFLIIAWVLTIPIFAALYQTFNLTKYIDENTAFSNLSVKALRNIKYCAALFSVSVATVVTTTVIISHRIDPTEDSAGFVMLGFIFTFTSGVIAVFVAVLQKLLQKAIDMKAENELAI